jgi:predicted dehydrogenase
MTEVLVVGGGSAGRRHARLLAERGLTVRVTDPVAPEGLPDGIAIVPYRDEIVREFRHVVIASPNVIHEEQTLAALDAGAHVLVEKPMAMTGAGAQRIVESSAGRVMVAYNLRLHPPVERFFELVRSGGAGRPLTASLWFGSHLPGWRPGVDYRRTYSARAALGGGVLLDAIHELDLAIWLLGHHITVRGAMLRRVSDLELDVEDVALAVGEAEDGTAVSLSLDYLSRAYKRGIEVVGTEATIRLDWATASITIAAGDDVHSEHASTPVAKSYERQADRFAAWVDHGVAPPVDAVEGAASVFLADDIRAAG